ncbi:hypothetical protein WJX73_001711 [Symbiochloris irregularis]|uniref:Uncharacterized protein n=1 Tax=Symbiochloris irregularis TaxID=706552 RepID=A0AAW1NMV0_9CHLO
MRALEWTRHFSEKTAETWRTNPHVLRLREKAESTAAKMQSNPLPTGLAAAALVGWVVCLFQWRRAARLKFALRRQKRVNEEAQAAQRALQMQREAEKRSQEEAQETEEQLKKQLEKETAARSRLQQYIANVHVQLQTMEVEARQLAERASEQSSHNRERHRGTAPQSASGRGTATLSRCKPPALPRPQHTQTAGSDAERLAKAGQTTPPNSDR